MLNIAADEPLATAAAHAIQTGDLPALKRLLTNNRGLATARLVDSCGVSRTLLHVAADWPGHFPGGAATVAALVEAGAEVDARVAGSHTEETPLHWAASSNDVDVLDALLDAGADIEASGGVIGSGTPLADARAFGQWRAAHRLVERGARTTLTDAATLGLMDRIEGHFSGASLPTMEEVTRAFWGACHGGQKGTAEYLLGRGADLNWIPPWEELTPLDVARRSDAGELVRWLQRRGARSADEIGAAVTCADAKAGAMKPGVVQFDGATAVGIEVRTSNRDEMIPGAGRIPPLWERFFSEGIADRVQSKIQPDHPAGVYSDYDSDYSGDFALTAGMMTEADAPVPEGLTKVAIPSGRYLVFRAEGEMPQALVDTWRAIWSHFVQESDSKRAYEVDFELYLDERLVDIYIGVR